MTATEANAGSGWKKNLLLLVFSSLVAFLIGEAALRAYFAVRIGPGVMLYGTPFYRNVVQQDDEAQFQSDDEDKGWTRVNSNALEGYSKYYPHQQRYGDDCVSEEDFEIRINNLGFRGEDVSLEKPAGTTRIVTLGASSTFGFCNRDQDAYPHQLEALLNEKGGETYEVINLGIPHLRSGQILSLFLQEALALQPDVVTFYEGHNDTHPLKVEPKRLTTRIPALDSTIEALGNYFIFFARLKSLLRLSSRGFTSEYLYGPAEAASKNLVENVSVIHEESEKRGIEFFVATQQRRSMMIDSKDLAGITYKEEVALVEQKLAEEGQISSREFGFLIHDIFMTDLTEWAKGNNVPLVDVVAALDQRRDTIVSPVHINAQGNEIIARAFADSILEKMEPENRK